jgi:hypothetical protein
MPRRQPQPTPQQQLDRLREYGLQIQPLGSNCIVRKGRSVAEIAPGPGGLYVVSKPPALEIGNELGRLLDGGYQKFFQTPTRKVPATAEQLRALHELQEALHAGLGIQSLYNQALGTVSSVYHYDRVRGRANP